MVGLNNDTSGRFFPNTPNSSCYYPSTVHEVALAGLVKALEHGEPFALLIKQWLFFPMPDLITRLVCCKGFFLTLDFPA
ncbi:MAG: hypothetical protein EBT92_00320 [Planctomycetes bacterium]|nr:hypothetical protein [Planctomycetota bacterium]